VNPQSTAKTNEAGMQNFNFVTGTGSDLRQKPLLSMKYGTTEGGTGHVGFICHKQPAMERAIRDKLGETKGCHLRVESEVVGIFEDSDHVYVDYKRADGSIHKIKARFLVGTDGKKGYVRKMYLEPKGIEMARTEKYVFCWCKRPY
jgi:2-polyprenyl-6-methoxyphenol hydroxylase-like FAD-dependent oxidoreductase